MFCSYTYGSIPFSMVNEGMPEGFNYRQRILIALKQNLEAICLANGFSAEIKGVRFGTAGSRVQNGEILICSIRDAAVMNAGEAADPNGQITPPSSRTRNIYLKLRLLVKGETCSQISDEMIVLRENYTDSLIKGLYGKNITARQLYSLLLEGISGGTGLIAYNISQFKEYGFQGDLELEAEVVFTYKEY